MLSISFIKHFALTHADIAYLIVMLGVLIEGEVVVIIAGIFSHLDSFSIYWVIVAIFLGCVLKSIIGYSIGSYLRNNHSHQEIVCQTERRIKYFFPNFINKPFLSIFLSRFLILGIYWFAVIYAGFNKVNIRTFIKAEILSFIVWTTVMLSLGYFFSYTALMISRDVRNFLGFLLLFFIGFFILEKIIAFVVELFSTKDHC
jgi:membrane protein DedA with SNARE-associated domain